MSQDSAFTLYMIALGWSVMFFIRWILVRDESNAVACFYFACMVAFIKLCVWYG